jgi:ATP-dependent RNA circularization protein (DNA/RNA ligase family)
LIGPGIQGNIYNLSDVEFHVFDVYDSKAGRYLDPLSRRELITRMGLKHVPVLAHYAELYDTLGVSNVEQLLGYAEGRSQLNSKQEREGVVFKQVDDGMTFKAISNKYLLGEK